MSKNFVSGLFNSNTNSKTDSNPVYLRSISSEQLLVTLSPNQTINNYMIFPPDTMLVATFYINNQTDIPAGSTGEVKILILDSKTGHSSVITLNSYVYGKYIENYPMTNITFTNTYSVDIEIYFQYTLKDYSKYSNPVIQDLTELLLIPNVVTNSLTGGTNFRYYGSISDFSFSNFSVGDTFYVLDQQVYGTSSTSAGYVKVPYVSNYTENINVSALGAAEDANLYFFTVDSTTLDLPSSVTTSYAEMNWVKIDFYSPLYISYTTQTLDIVYDSTTNEFTLSTGSDLSIQSVAIYEQSVSAPFCTYSIS